MLKLASEQLKISSNTNSYPLLLTDKTNTHCSLRNYNETVLSDILHDGNKACLYNHKIIACWYFFNSTGMTEFRAETLTIFVGRSTPGRISAYLEWRDLVFLCYK